MNNFVKVSGVSYGVKIDTEAGKALLDTLIRNPNIRFFSKVSRNGVLYSLTYTLSDKRVTLQADGNAQKAFNFDNLAKYPWSRDV